MYESRYDDTFVSKLTDKERSQMVPGAQKPELMAEVPAVRRECTSHQLKSYHTPPPPRSPTHDARGVIK